MLSFIDIDPSSLTETSPKEAVASKEPVGCDDKTSNSSPLKNSKVFLLVSKTISPGLNLVFNFSSVFICSVALGSNFCRFSSNT